MEFSPPRLPKHFVTVLGEDKVFPNWNNDYDILLSFLTLYQSKCCLGRVWICRRKMRPCLMIWVVVKRGRQEKLLGNVTRIPTCLLQREKFSYCTFLQLGQMFKGLRLAHTTKHPWSAHPAFLCHQQYHLVSNSKIICIANFPDPSSNVLGITTDLETHWYFLKMAS